MSKLNKIQEFILFCTEAYKTKYNLTGYQVFSLFTENKIFNYLENGYEVLHTQSLEYTISEINELIKNKK